MELSEILGGAPAPVEPESTVETTPEPVAQDATPAVEPTTTVEQPAERPRDERGRFSQQQEAQPEERQPHMVPVSALLEERRKRQEAEARYQKPEQPQVTDEQFWQAPAQAAQQMLGQHGEQMQAQIQGIKYELAEDLTRQLHTDYDSVRDGFIAKVHTGDPWAIAIAQQMGAQPNPAKFVYDQAKKLEALSAVGDPKAFEERIRADERARMALQQSGQKPPPPNVPRSLNSEPSAPTPSTPGSFEATPLENLFERKF
jgi:hypothetical protein